MFSWLRTLSTLKRMEETSNSFPSHPNPLPSEKPTVLLPPQPLACPIPSSKNQSVGLVPRLSPIRQPHTHKHVTSARAAPVVRAIDFPVDEQHDFTFAVCFERLRTAELTPRMAMTSNTSEEVCDHLRQTEDLPIRENLDDPCVGLHRMAVSSQSCLKTFWLLLPTFVRSCAKPTLR